MRLVVGHDCSTCDGERCMPGRACSGWKHSVRSCRQERIGRGAPAFASKDASAIASSDASAAVDRSDSAVSGRGAAQVTLKRKTAAMSRDTKSVAGRDARAGENEQGASATFGKGASVHAKEQPPRLRPPRLWLPLASEGARYLLESGGRRQSADNMEHDPF